MLRLIIFLGVVLGAAAASDADDTTQVAPDARAAELAKRIESVTRAIEETPRDDNLFLSRAKLQAAAGQHERCLADCNQVLLLNPRAVDVLDLRGSAHYALGQIAESLVDFDRYLTLRPDQKPWHWKRGISLHDAGRFDEGRAQFEGYQTVADNDVENAVWRFLCMARASSVAEARRSLLRVREDRRVPMKEIYALFAGVAQADDVLTAARDGSPSAEALNERLFYAHLYLGLYNEALGNQELAVRHIATAAEQHKIGHYMWNVADVHARFLQQPARKP